MNHLKETFIPITKLDKLIWRFSPNLFYWYCNNSFINYSSDCWYEIMENERKINRCL